MVGDKAYLISEKDNNIKIIEYKDIEYIEIGWFGKEKIKTRQQTYIEYMIERIEELIEETKSTGKFEIDFQLIHF